MRESALARGFSHIAAGTLASQIVILGVTALVARIYSVQAIGSYSAIVALATSIAPLTTAKLEAAVPPAESNADAWRLVRVGLCLAAGAFVILEGGAMLLHAFGRSFSEDMLLERWVWVPLIAFSYAIFGIALSTALRERDYRSAGWRPLAQNVAGGGTQIALSRITGSFAGLATGDLVGRAIGVSVLTPSVLRLRESVQGASTDSHFWGRYRPVVWNYLPAYALDNLATTLLVMSAAWWFGPQVAGYVGMTQRLLAVPVALLGAALGQVIMAEASHSLRSGQRVLEFRRVTTILVSVAVATFAVLFIAGPVLFVSILGPEWEESGQLARLMALSAAVGLVWNPLSALFISFQRWRTFLVLAVIRVSLSLGAGWTAHSLGANWIWCITALALGGTVGQLVGLGVLRRIVDSIKAQEHEPPATATQ